MKDLNLATPDGLRGENIDQREVAHYDSIAQTWWDPTGPFWPLHKLNALRVSYLRKQLCLEFDRDPSAPQPLSGLSVLDIGCGGGILSESMARLGATVHGIDVVSRNIHVATEHARAENLQIEYELADLSRLESRPRIYDIVLNMEVIEHVPDYEKFLIDSASLVAPDGVMAVATINRNWLSWLTAIVGAEYILRWLPMGTHRWGKFVKPEEVNRVFQATSLQKFSSTGVRVNPLNHHFSFSRRMTVNYMLLARKVR